MAIFWRQEHLICQNFTFLKLEKSFPILTLNRAAPTIRDGRELKLIEKPEEKR